MLNMAENKRFFVKQLYFVEGENAGHLLATIVKSQQGSSHIAKLVREDGGVVVEAPDILGVLKEFYVSLYSSRSEGSAEDLAGYLSEIPTSRLSPESMQLLDRPITIEELERALQQTPNEKAPGSDGLPGEFYKIYADLLLPQLLMVFNEALESGTLPASMNEAIIVLILKPDKDPSSPGSCRPISLLPVDIKLLAKVLANRLSLVVTEIVHDDQTGFMPYRSTAINL